MLPTTPFTSQKGSYGYCNTGVSGTAVLVAKWPHIRILTPKKLGLHPNLHQACGLHLETEGLTNLATFLLSGGLCGDNGTCSLGGVTHARLTQPPPAAGWLQQAVSTIKPAISQKLYNMFPYMHGFNTNTDNNTDARQCQMACSAAVLPTQSILQTPLLEVINQQPKLSAASFPDNACSQPVTQTSGYTTNKIPVIPPTSVITRQPSCRLACSPAVISTQTLHPETANKKQNYSAASFPDDVYSQPVIQASGNDGTDPRPKYSTDTINYACHWISE